MTKTIAAALVVTAGFGILSTGCSREGSVPKSPPNANGGGNPSEKTPNGDPSSKPPESGAPSDKVDPGVLLTESDPKSKKIGAALKDDPVGTIIGAGQKAAKSIDAKLQKKYALTEDEEIELGRKINRLVLDRSKVSSTNPVRIVDLAKPVLDVRARKRIPYTFAVIDSKQINAFSHVGGYVYFFQGLIDICGDDTELQFVLAHEIAHVDLGHCKEQVLVQARVAKFGGGLFGDKAGEILGTLAQLGYGAIEAGYSEDKEFEADEWAFRTLLKMGKDRASMLRFLGRLAKLEPEVKKSDSKKIRDRLGEEFAGHFRTHPPSIDRIRRLEAIKVD